MPTAMHKAFSLHISRASACIKVTRGLLQHRSLTLEFLRVDLEWRLKFDFDETISGDDAAGGLETTLGEL